MRALVTGAGGFLGGHLVAELARRGHEVVALVRPGAAAAVPAGVELRRGDVTDPASLDFRGVDWVFHCAAAMATRRSERARLYAVNHQGTVNVLEECLKRGVERLVHVSSVVAVGGSAEAGRVFAEDAAFPAASGALANIDSKRRGEAAVLDAVARRGLRASVANPSLIYGARDALKAARAGNVAVARGKAPFYTAGGVNVVAVEDVVRGLIKIAEAGRIGERYILCGENLSVRSLLGLIAAAAGRRAPRFLLPGGLLRAAGRICDWLRLDGPLNAESAAIATMHFWCDGGKARQELGLVATPAAEAVARSVGWMRAEGMV